MRNPNLTPQFKKEKGHLGLRLNPANINENIVTDLY